MPNLIEKRLGKLPKRLNELYEEMYSTKLNSYEPEERAMSECAFRWLLCSHEPLTTDEFLAAVSFCSGEDIELSKETLLAMCFNFIVHDDSVGTFRFAHLSVREYLESKANYEASLNHATAAFCCLSYLTLPPKRDQAPSRGFRYAYFYWGLHSASSGKRRLEGELQELFRKFLGSLQNPSPYFVRWNEELSVALPERSPGSDELSDHILNCMRSTPANSIFAASAWGFPEILETEVGFDPVILEAANLNGETALILSSRYHQRDFLRLLLHNRVHLEAKELAEGYTALLMASSLGHKMIVRMLLDHRANVEAKSNHGETPLFLASQYGNKEIVKLLLEEGANANTRNIS